MNVPIASVVLLAVIAIVPTSRDTQERKLDVVGALFSIVSLGSLLFAIIEGPERGWTDPLTLTGFIIFGIIRSRVVGPVIIAVVRFFVVVIV